MALWNEYINIYVRPRINVSNISWNTKSKPHYNTTYFLCHQTGKLLEKVNTDNYNTYEAIRSQPGSRTTKFHNTPSSTMTNPDTNSSLQPVDVTHLQNQVKIICPSNINNHGPQTTTSIQNKYSFYRRLPKSLCRICRKIALPSDGSQKLIEYVKKRDASLLGVSDASVVEENGTHAWIITTGEPEHLSDPFMKLEGHGPVDGDILTFLMDNQGVQKSCHNPKINRIGHYRKANIDLQMELVKQTSELNIKHEWVRGHQDKDLNWNNIDELRDLDLTPAATLNIYCDRIASEAQKSMSSHPTGEILPAEKWALFSTYPNNRKITGNLNEGILQTLHTEEIISYISKKHNITEDKLYHIDTNGLNIYLKKLRPHTRASTVKLIHQWIPTNDFIHKQHRGESPLCTRCMTHSETAKHILTCQNSDAQKLRTEALYTCLKDLEHAHTSKYILECVEHNIACLLQITSEHKYQTPQPQPKDLIPTLTDAKRYQKIIGWETRSVDSPQNTG
jgi:hypothetical protein